MRLLYEIQAFKNLTDLGFDLSRSLKVKSDSGVGLYVNDFPLVYNGKFNFVALIKNSVCLFS